MWKQLFALLFGFARLGIVGGEGGGPGDGEEDGGDGDGQDGDAGDGDAGGADEQDDDGGDGGDTTQQNVGALRKKHREEERKRLEAEGRAQALQEELERVRSGQQPRGRQEDDDTPPAGETETAKFVRIGNKTLKTAAQTSNQAIALAQDAADRVEFYSTVEPAMAKKYRERVEKRLGELRKQGQNAPRGAIMTFLVGEDTIKASQSTDGKKQKQKQREDADERVTQARGKPNAAPRSDKNSKERVDERKARANRLADVPI